MENIEKLQAREEQLWETINAEVGSSMGDLIAELIEVSIELEKRGIDYSYQITFN